MWIVVISIVCILLGLLVAFTLWLPSFVLAGSRQTLEEAIKWQSERYDTSFYKDLPKSNYEVKGEDGYALHVQLLKNPEHTTKYMILSHGYTDNRIGSLKYVPVYLKLGYNCIIYDLLGHCEKDTFIVPKNSLDMAERTKGYKEYHVVPNAAHAESVLTDLKLYEKYVSKFLSRL